MQHASDLTVFIPPLLTSFPIHVFQIRAVPQPYLHFIRRTNRHQKIAFEFCVGSTLLAEPFGNVSADRFTGSPHLIGYAIELFDLWKLQRYPMQIERDTVGSLEHLEIFESGYCGLRPFLFLISDYRHLITDPWTPKASARGLSPVTFSAQESLFRPVSCYAFFKGWLLLSQPPGCCGIPTSFPT